MLASAIVCHLSVLGEKAFRAGLKRAAKRELAAHVPTKPAPVKLQERLEPAACKIQTVPHVVLDSAIPASAPGEAWEVMSNGKLHWIADDAEAANAALRSHLAGPTYGPEVTRIVRRRFFAAGGEEMVILKGRLGDLLRLMPDEMTRRDWVGANVMGLRVAGAAIPMQVETYAE